jgi:hypothetical protein
MPTCHTLGYRKVRLQGSSRWALLAAFERFIEAYLAFAQDRLRPRDRSIDNLTASEDNVNLF